MTQFEYCVVMKTYVSGTCYYDTTKYCPTDLQSCKSKYNRGHRWTLKGEFQLKI